MNWINSVLASASYRHQYAGYNCRLPHLLQRQSHDLGILSSDDHIDSCYGHFESWKHVLHLNNNCEHWVYSSWVQCLLNSVITESSVSVLLLSPPLIWISVKGFGYCCFLRLFFCFPWEWDLSTGKLKSRGQLEIRQEHWNLYFSYFPQITLFWPASWLPWPPSLSDVLSSIDCGPARPPPRQHLLRQVLSSSPPPFALGLQQCQPDKYKDQTEHNKSQLTRAINYIFLSTTNPSWSWAPPTWEGTPRHLRRHMCPP